MMKETVGSKIKLKIASISQGFEIIYNINNIIIYRVLTIEALKYLSEGTYWIYKVLEFKNLYVGHYQNKPIICCQKTGNSKDIMEFQDLKFKFPYEVKSILAIFILEIILQFKRKNFKRLENVNFTSKELENSINFEKAINLRLNYLGYILWPNWTQKSIVKNISKIGIWLTKIGQIFEDNKLPSENMDIKKLNLNWLKNWGKENEKNEKNLPQEKDIEKFIVSLEEYLNPPINWESEYNWDLIKSIALNVRNEVIKDLKNTSLNNLNLYRACGIANYRLWLKLKPIIPKIELAWGYANGNGHYFLLVDNIVIDITSTQFNSNKPVLILPLKEARYISKVYNIKKIFKTIEEINNFFMTTTSFEELPLELKEKWQHKH
jgi:hypothetical protein